jgi:hypothetical protein
VSQVADQARDAGPRLESGECHLVRDDGRQSDERHAQGVMVEQRNAEQGDREKDEVDGNRPNARDLGCSGLGRSGDRQKSYRDDG